MEFKYRAVDEGEQPRHPPPPPPPPPLPRHLTTTSSSSSYSYFTEQAIRAGYRIPGLGRGNEYFNPGFGLANQYFRNPFDVHEMIQTEIEKERIREEIVLADIARRRALLAEVRREMMIDGELLALRDGGGGGGGGRGRGSAFDGFTSFPLRGGMMDFEPKEVPFQQNEGRSLEERIAMSLEKGLGMGARREHGGLEMVPFQRASVEPKIKEATPSSSEVHKKKEKIVIMAKPDASLSGAKRKAVPPKEDSASEFLSNGVAKKKVKEEWSCSLCQVSATSERSLNDHIQGKKHKSKEAALRAKRNGNNIGIGVFPKKVVKPAVEVTDNLISELGPQSKGEVLQFNQTGESSLHINSSAELSTENNTSVLQESEKTDYLRKKKLGGVQKAPKKGQKKVKVFTFWCEMCQVGANNENVMEEHRKGKKHMARFQEARENGKAIPAPQIVGIQGVNDADEATKQGDKENVEDVDGTVHQEDEDCQTARNKADVLVCDLG